MILLGLFFAGLQGCDSKKGDEKGTEAEKEKKDLKELFPGSAPAIPPIVSALTFGMSVEEATKVAPQLMEAKYQTLRLDEYGKNVSMEPRTVVMESEEQFLRALALTVPETAKGELLVPSWGQPRTHTYEVRDFATAGAMKTVTEEFWYDAEKGIRAKASEHAGYKDMLSLEIGAYTPAKSVLVAGKGLGGPLEGVLGMRAEALKSKFGQRYTFYTNTSTNEVHGKIELPPFELENSASTVGVEFGEAGVKGFSFWFETDEAEKKEVEALFEAAFAAPIAGKDDLSRDILTYGDDPKLFTRWDPEAHRVRVYVGDVNSFL
ncbi:MAG: hypothetical protein AUK47_11345 [Deltaproteobacteria bacterium CG2_30_63_29]|nr:MAG: hypothetical protein AUK47_11345 [Deltaproteobacteria bacterium CG2_30_63_29]PJB36405.1 MAG: hypothetical protein CO108_23535 [Deltaproteobacteria bacterium CG_4_9_14_3_um_filter_63_12]